MKLLVVIPDRLSAIVEKGELTDRYYNPGVLFDEVHILMTNDDQPDPRAVQKTVGKARLALHNLPMPGFRRSVGWWNAFLSSWMNKGVALAREVGPQLIRAYGNFGNGYLAAQIRKQTGVPFVVSLHTHPDADMRGATPWRPHWRERLRMELYRRFERESLAAADRVIIVYESQSEYATQNGARDVRLIYNVINPTHLGIKTNYQLGNPPRLISVGRQFKEKNPENIIRAMVGLKARLTLVGNGPYHDRLRSMAQGLGLAERVDFIRALPNDRLSELWPEYDLFAVHCDAWGIPKAVMEPLLAGLPVVVNRRRPEPVHELNGDWVMQVDNTESDYRQAITQLLAGHDRRATLGRRGHAYAWKQFSPKNTELQLIELYRELVPNLDMRVALHSH